MSSIPSMFQKTLTYWTRITDTQSLRRVGVTT